MNQELFDVLRDYIDKDVLQRIKVNGNVLSKNSGACYTASKIAERILMLLGYKCEVRRVVVIAGDRRGKEIFKRQTETQKFDKQEVIDAGCWLLGLGVPPMFHYVVWFPDEKEILDLTYGQADRPKYGLNAKAYWEYIDNIPESIVSIDFVDKPPINFDPIYHYPLCQRMFNYIEEEGYKKLKDAGYGISMET